MDDMTNYEKMKNRCTNYDKEIECCRILSDWSEAMPVLQPCIESPCKYFKPYTNYDRIKQMSVEEMAEFLCKISGKNEKEIIGTFVCNYKEYYEQWLLQEVNKK